MSISRVKKLKILGNSISCTGVTTLHFLVGAVSAANQCWKLVARVHTASHSAALPHHAQICHGGSPLLLHV
jgi:hypothetical protein